MPDPERPTKQSFRAELERLVANFAANEDEYTSHGYPEAQVRLDFLDPLFRALGWDIENRANLPYKARDVIVEWSTEEGRFDYTFRIGALPKFVVEAKAPHHSLDREDHVFQVKSYAWSTKEIFAAVLTDFEEFRFYDASQEPDRHHPHRGLIYDFRYKQYLDKIDELWNFSRHRVAEGSIEALLPRDKLSLRFRKPPDDKFLEDMTAWRTDLARAVHKRNPQLSDMELTDVVQRLLDRLIFIRVAEDRRILKEKSLLDRAHEWEAIGGRLPLLPMLNELFHVINNDFNGEIFKRHSCEDINLEGEPTLHRIITELYPPKRPYRFDKIPVDIFGAVYERYLGKTIYVKGKKVEVADKPEVRKAGGVYYTPRYIVDYIVKHTVGKVIEGKPPQEIESIKILDPACGSGSFLLGAYQCLIDYHVEWYEKHPREANAHPMFPELIRNGNGEPRLSLNRKAKILSHNLYGVDLDHQAVEITMMNLYLKALEGEREIPRNKAVLPELKFNIRCGNSLIAPDIAQPPHHSPVAPASRRSARRPEQKLSPEELQRLNPFDWHSKTDGFGDILQEGGFDAVIGNPPYVRMEGFKQIKPYLRHTFASHDERTDLYVYFIERSHSVLKSGGRFGMIVSNKFLRAGYGKKLRDHIRANATLERIADFAGLPVFVGATVRPIVLLTSKNGTRRPVVYSPPPTPERFESLAKGTLSVEEVVTGTDYTVSPSAPTGAVWTFEREEETNLLEKLRSKSEPLIRYCRGQICMGVKSGLTEAFVIDQDTRKAILKRNPRAKEIIKPFLNGRDITRYDVHFRNSYLLYTYHGIDISRYPAVERHLRPYKSKLQRRATKQAWYELQQPQLNFANFMDKPKIIFPT